MSVIKIKKDGKEYFIELPEAELNVLGILTTFSRIKAMTIETMRNTKGNSKTKYSYATISTLLKRLRKKNLVSQETIKTTILGGNIRRIVWSPTFCSMEKIETLKSAP